MAMPLALGVLLGLYGYWQAPEPAVESILELGRYQQGQDDQAVTSSNLTIAQLNSAIEDIGQESDRNLFQAFSASTLEGGWMIRLRLDASANSGGEAVLSRAMDRVKEAQALDWEQAKQSLEGQIETTRSRRDSLQEKMSAVQAQLDTLAQEEEALREELAASKDRLAAIRDQRPTGSATEEPSVAWLLFNSQLRQAAASVRDLRDRLEYRLPEERQQLRRKQTNLQPRLAKARADLAEQQANRSGSHPARVAIAPHPKPSGSGPGWAVWTVIGLVLGAFLGLVIAVARELWQVNRHRILA